MSDDAIMKFILLVEVHFPRPKFNGDEKREALWMRSMREILSEYEPEVLAKAAETIVRTRDPRDGGSMFPKPSECIYACERIIRQAEALVMLKETEGNWKRMEASPPTALPLCEITPSDVAWEHWLAHFKDIGRHDLAGEAEAKGRIKASRRWPASDVTIFEPAPKSANLLAALPQPRTIPN